MKQTPIQVQEQSLKSIVATHSKEDQERIAEYVDRFERMINKGGQVVEIAFSIVGTELAKKYG